MAEQMKASGVVWIGDIPESWRIGKVRFETTLRGEKGYYSDQDKYIGLENISSYTGKFLPSETEYDPGIYDIYRKGDLLYNKLRPYLAKAMIAKDDGFCTGELEVINGYNGDMRYLFYYLLSDGFLKIVDASTYGTKMPRASWDYIKNLPILLLDYYEQQTIADYLDKRCGEIDSIITDIEKQIELLKQYKKSLITETVTKGLDKSVPMKDSGIEWIGEIPSSWNVKKLKYICKRIGDIDHYMPDSVDEGIPYIMTGDFIGDENDIDFDNCKQVSLKDYRLLSNKIKVEYGDIILARYATIGVVRYVDTDRDFLVSYSCAIIKLFNDEMNSKYIFYYLKSSVFSEEIKEYINTNTQGNVGLDSIGRCRVTIPSMKDQAFIADYLDIECNKINAVIETKQQQLELMQQHKKSLIYEYVTGKKRVKEAM